MLRPEPCGGAPARTAEGERLSSSPNSKRIERLRMSPLLRSKKELPESVNPGSGNPFFRFPGSEKPETLVPWLPETLNSGVLAGASEEPGVEMDRKSSKFDVFT